MSIKTMLLFFLLTLVLIGTAAFFVFRKETPKYTINTSSTAVIQQIRSLNRLETASFTIEKIIDAGTSGGKFEQLLFGDRILLIAHGEVIAGIDMTKVNESTMKIEDKHISLVLPAPQILTTTLDNDQTRVYDRQTGLLSKGDKDLESEARLAAESTIRDAACKSNILQTASDNAKKQLTALLKALQFETIDITIPQGNC